MLVLLGAIQFGIFFHRYQSLQAAAREGARLASLPQSSVGQIKDVARMNLSAINASTANEGCGGGLTLGRYCITVAVGATTVTGVGCTGASGGADCALQPCNLKTGETVTLRVEYRTTIDIPVWASPVFTVAGQGSYRCE